MKKTIILSLILISALIITGCVKEKIRIPEQEIVESGDPIFLTEAEVKNRQASIVVEKDIVIVAYLQGEN